MFIERIAQTVGRFGARLSEFKVGERVEILRATKVQRSLVTKVLSLPVLFTRSYLMIWFYSISFCVTYRGRARSPSPTMVRTLFVSVFFHVT